MCTHRGLVFFAMIVMGAIACTAPGLARQATPTPVPNVVVITATPEPGTNSDKQIITRILPPDTIAVSASADGGGSQETTVILTDQTDLTTIDGSPMAFDDLFFGAQLTVTGSSDDGTQVVADKVVVDAAPMDAPLADTYVDEEFGYSLEIPANWYISDRISNPPPDRLTRTVSSFFPAGVGPTPENQLMIRIEVVEIGEAEIEAWVDEEEAGLTLAPAVPVFEEWRDLPSGLHAYRVQRRTDAEQMEWAYLYTVINGRGVLLVGSGDTTRFDDIANTLAEVIG